MVAGQASWGAVFRLLAQRSWITQDRWVLPRTDRAMQSRGRKCRVLAKTSCVQGLRVLYIVIRATDGEKRILWGIFEHQIIEFWLDARRHPKLDLA